MTRNELAAAAHRLADYGYDIFPLVPGGKTPATSHGFHDATRNHDRITAWWHENGDYNIGIRTGIYPNGDDQHCLVVIDLDEHVHGISGNDEWHQLSAPHGETPTIEALTPSGGRHLYHWAATEIRNSAGHNFPDGIDIRGEGGYVVAPPSTTPVGAYHWDVEHDPTSGDVVAPAPPWLTAILTATPPQQTPRIDLPHYTGPQRPGDLWAANTTWPQLLQRDGATYIATHNHPTGPYETWARPGCMRDHGEHHTGATLYYHGSDSLTVHTTMWPYLTTGTAYTKLGYLAATRHGGNMAAAAAWCANNGYRPETTLHINTTSNNGSTPPGPGDDPPLTPPSKPPFFIHWPTFWTEEPDTEEWVIYPLLPKGRAAAIYAPAKAGKSTLILAAAAAAATGQPIYGGPPTHPRHILYLDYEMTRDDLHERLTDLGYGPHTDLTHLHYALLPRIPDLDTQQGADHITTIAAEVAAEAVIIDTIGRAVSGDENDARTIQTFYRTTGSQLKALGIAWLRADHTGKDQDKGQRGSSAKNDDVDIVWKLTRTDDGATLTHGGITRITWVPETIDLIRVSDDNTDQTHYRLRHGPSWPAGTKDCAEQLDQLGLPVDISRRKAAEALKQAGHKVRTTTIVAAVRYRKETLGIGGNHPGNHYLSTGNGTQDGTTGTITENTCSDNGNHHGNHWEPLSEATWEPGSLTSKGTGSQPEPPTGDWMDRTLAKYQTQTSHPPDPEPNHFK